MGSSVAVLRFGLSCSGMSYVCVVEANQIGQTCVAAPLSIISSSFVDVCDHPHVWCSDYAVAVAWYCDRCNLQSWCCI